MAIICKAFWLNCEEIRTESRWLPSKSIWRRVRLCCKQASLSEVYLISGVKVVSLSSEM